MKSCFVSLSPDQPLVLSCVQYPVLLQEFFIKHLPASKILSDHLMIVTMSLSKGVWSSPTLCPAYFTLDPDTSAYFAPSLNLG